MNFAYLTAPADQERGVRGKVLGPHDAYVFCPLSPFGRFVMDGVPYDLEIVFLDERARIINSTIMQAERGGAEIPHGAFAAVEALPGVLGRAPRRHEIRWSEALAGLQWQTA